MSLTRCSWAQTWLGSYDWDQVRNWLAARAVTGMEAVAPDLYRRTWRLGDAVGVVQVGAAPDRGCVDVCVDAPVQVSRSWLDPRIARVFDLQRDATTAVAHLSGDAWLAAVLARHPGVRVPGGWEPFELAVRAVLGQQVTIGAARALVSHVVQLAGPRLPTTLAGGGLTHVFPTPAELLATDLAPLRLPGARRATLIALARAACERADLFAADPSLEVIVARLTTVPGIGEWTAQYIALRALGHPDAFPSSDVGLLRAAASESGARPSPAALRLRAEGWRPHRAYAAQVLWESCLMPHDVGRDGSPSRPPNDA